MGKGKEMVLIIFEFFCIEILIDLFVDKECLNYKGELILNYGPLCNLCPQLEAMMSKRITHFFNRDIY